MIPAGKKYIHFDLRTKIIILIVVNVLLFLSTSFKLECILTVFCLLVTAIGGQPKSAFGFLVFFISMAAAEQFMIPSSKGAVSTLILFVAVAVRKILPCLMIGKWILATTGVSEFVAVMWKLKLPLNMIIPVSVVFRYFPTLKEEWKSLRIAMKMRGINISMEHVFVPLLISAINISDELSAAALCRGLDSPREHTTTCNIRFQGPDYIAVISSVVLLIFQILLKGGQTV